MSRSEGALEALARLVHAIDTVESWGGLGDDPLFVECFAAARKLTIGVRVWPRPDVPRRESPTPVDLSPLSPERLVKATEDVMRQKTSEVERAATDAGSIAAVDSAGAKAAGALPIARQRSSDEACKACGRSGV